MDCGDYVSTCTSLTSRARFHAQTRAPEAYEIIKLGGPVFVRRVFVYARIVSYLTSDNNSCKIHFLSGIFFLKGRCYINDVVESS